MISCKHCADNSGKGLIGTGSSRCWWVSLPIPVVVDVEVWVIVPHQLPKLFGNTTQEQHVITLCGSSDPRESNSDPMASWVTKVQIKSGPSQGRAAVILWRKACSTQTKGLQSIQVLVFLHESPVLLLIPQCETWEI